MWRLCIAGLVLYRFQRDVMSIRDWRIRQHAVKRQLMIFELFEFVVQRLLGPGFVIEHRAFASVVFIDPIDPAVQRDLAIRPLQRLLEPTLTDRESPALRFPRIGPCEIGGKRLLPAHVITERSRIFRKFCCKYCFRNVAQHVFAIVQTGVLIADGVVIGFQDLMQPVTVIALLRHVGQFVQSRQAEHARCKKLVRARDKTVVAAGG